MIKSKLNTRERQIIASQLANSATLADKKAVVRRWRTHLNACAILEQFRCQVCEPDINDLDDLRFWQHRVIETGEAVLAGK